MKTKFFILAFSMVLAFASVRNAEANLVQNGNFSSVVYSGTAALTTIYGQFGGSYLTVSGWSTTGYNFVYAPGTGDAGTTSGAGSGQPNEAPGQYKASNGYGNTYMWGPNNGSANGLTATDPAGGNYIAGDGAFSVGAITQSVTGLTAGQLYALKFYWGGAQQQSYSGTTTEQWQVGLGSQTFTTGTAAIASHGFSGWLQQTFLYTATSGTETLSFLAIGTPSGEPPFSLLGGVDLEVVPEFTNWMVFLGFGVVCVLFEAMRRRRRSPGAPVA